MTEVSDHEDFVLRYMLDIEDEPFTAAQSSPEMIRHRFMLSNIEVTDQHVMHLQWSLCKKGLLDKRTTPDGVRFKISPKGKLFCKRNGITP